jgi:hypothetical protein
MPKQLEKKKDIKVSKKISIHEKTKMFMFSRWITINYDTDILNSQAGDWWKTQINYFEREVYQNYIASGNYTEVYEFFETSPNIVKEFFEYEKIPRLSTRKTISKKKNKIKIK